MSITIYGPGVNDRIPTQVGKTGRAVEQIASTEASSNVNDVTDESRDAPFSTFKQLKQREGSQHRSPSKQAQQVYKETQDPKKEVQKVIHVTEIMNAPVVSLKGLESLKTLDKVFNETGYRHIPIVNENGKVLGILSDRDLLDVKFSHPDTWHIIDCEDALQRPLMDIQENTDIRLLAQRFLGESQDAAIVMNAQGRVRGIVTLTDILKAIVTRPDIEFWG